MAPGYYNDPEATEEAFGEYGLHTGDVGYVDEDGYLHVLNRLDDRIITGGENVEPREIVSVLTNHPGVEDAAVVGLTDDEWGQRVGAQVIRSDPDLTATTLLSFAEQRLAGFKLPQTLSFERPISRTDSSTIDREAVRQHLSTHGFEPARTAPNPDDDAFEQAVPEPIPDADPDSETPAGSDTGEARRDDKSDEAVDLYGAPDSTDDSSANDADHIEDHSPDSESSDNQTADTVPADDN